MYKEKRICSFSKRCKIAKCFHKKENHKERKSCEKACCIESKEVVVCVSG